MYEMTFLVADVKDTKEVKSICDTLDIKVNHEDAWGEKTLAYPIKAHTSAHYFSWDIEMPEDKVSDFKQRLNFNERIIRYLILKKE